ncbi:MAG: hypothetical protein ABI556_01190 [Gemmatimonadales bacterium]
MPSRLLMYGRFAFGLPAFLRRRMTPDDASAIIKGRLASRENNFLRLVRSTVFDRAESPYRSLMRDAGCEPGDVELLVSKEGLDAALCVLSTAGVQLSFDEFKGRAPIVRGGRTIEITETSFDNPLNSSGMISQTTGSTGSPTRVNQDLEHVEAMLPGRILQQVANGVFGQPTILYRAGLPSSAAVQGILGHFVMGNPVRRWFSPVAPGDIGAPMRFRVAQATMPIIARLAGQTFPTMEVVSTRDAIVVARAAAAFVKNEGSCLVRCAISTSLAVAIAAVEEGIDLNGVTFMGAAEPASQAKVAGIRNSGAAYATHYSMNEAGMVGAACANGADDTDVHFMRDSLALVPGTRSVDSHYHPAVAIALTSLLRSAPKILINVDIGDFGIVEERRCGCLLGELGLVQHVRQIRSAAKLTGRGVTLVGSDIAAVIEELLPARFGGTALDYQLVEEENVGGLTVLTLLVSPSIRLDDERAPAMALYDALAAGRPGASFSGAILKGGDAVKVRRERPVPNSRGKQPAFRTASASQ